MVVKEVEVGMLVVGQASLNLDKSVLEFLRYRG